MASSCPTPKHARPFAIEIEEGCDNLDKQVSRDCLPHIYVDAPESMIQESSEEASKTVCKLKEDA